MNFIYNTAIALYCFGIRTASLRNGKARRMKRGRARVGEYLQRVIDPGARYIWVHASSLGEFEQGLPLIERIKERFPDKRILLTFFSPSGYEVRSNHPLADAVCYLPADLPSGARAFVDSVPLEMAVFIKYEFWGNYLEQLRRRGVPVYLVSAVFRKSQPFFRFYGGMFRGMLRCYTRIFVQDEASKALLESVGVTAVSVAGDTRFDRVAGILARAASLPTVEAFAKKGEGCVIVAGSTWQEDERLVIPYFNRKASVKLIIAPHEVTPGRIAAIEAMLERSHCRLSQATEEEARRADCLVVDCYGKLSSIYRYGDVAYVGGGFGAGIHNIVEPAVYGLPVLFGPRHGKFREARDLTARGGAFAFTDGRGFTQAIEPLVDDRDYRRLCGDCAGGYVRENLGASERILREIFG